jgi:hypothetical protein
MAPFTGCSICLVTCEAVGYPCTFCMQVRQIRLCCRWSIAVLSISLSQLLLSHSLVSSRYGIRMSLRYNNNQRNYWLSRTTPSVHYWFSLLKPRITRRKAKVSYLSYYAPHKTPPGVPFPYPHPPIQPLIDYPARSSHGISRSHTSSASKLVSSGNHFLLGNDIPLSSRMS